ncbi:MAG: phospholipid carrier-dependent glycosyltransferase [Candidatus Altiarchaeales archaeon]|nr:phospholipid carrier-dependent glycosyltransferase [Candidatus Altiarchaeales archaeon]MBD3417061.1 phospholipid carrier-dependent glycosyltransferase [Candidatus Altiarchaeales archaeon]
MKRKKKPKKLFGVLDEQQARLAIVALFIIAFSLRLYYLQPGLWHTDSVIAAQEAERSVEKGRLHYLQGDVGYGGFAAFNTLIYLIWHTATGSDSAEGVLLFTNALLGALGCVLIYYLTVKLTESREAGIYAGIILAFLPLHLSLSTYLKDLVLGSAALMATAYALIKAREEDTTHLKVLAGALWGFAIAVRHQELLFLAPLILFYYHDSPPFELKRKRRGGWKFSLMEDPFDVIRDVSIIVVTGLVVFVLFYVPKMMHEPGFSLFEAIRSAGSAQGQAGVGLFTETFTRYSIPWATKTLTYLGWLVLIGSIVVNYGRGRRGVWLVLVAWMTLYFMIFGNFSGASPYFFFHAFPPAVMMMGWGLEYLQRNWGNIANIVVILLVAWMFIGFKPVLDYRRMECGPCEFSKRIAEVAPGRYVVIGMDETRHYEYYGHPIMGLGHPNPFQTDEMTKHMKMLDDYMSNGTAVYITTAGLSYEPINLQGLIERGAIQFDPELMVPVNRMNMKPYMNIVYDKENGMLVDAETGSPIPPSGLYGLELFNRYKSTIVFSMETEDWHHADLDQSKYTTTLFKLEPRQRQMMVEAVEEN